jgi:hypothetical protein
VQQEPNEGQPATERTDVWIVFDDRTVYVSARCWDSQPARAISNEMRRDAVSIFDNELFAVSFDTFHDRRNAFIFTVNLAGGLHDAYVTDERDFNRDWNTVWDATTSRFDQGWTVEIAIPFHSLRYKSGAQEWGVNLRRQVRWKNETSYLARVPAAMGRRGMNKVSSAATLTGIETPTGRNYEFKPYAIADLTTDRTANPPTSNDFGRNAGLDVKVGLTAGLTADLSYNTDFAQVEVDEQQVNLTRFNLFFPEKRDFFLEGQGIFAFGGVQNSPRNGVGPGGSNNQNPSPVDAPTLFFSRRIGFAGGRRVPTDLGGRVTGKAGRYSIGLLNIRTGDDEPSGTSPTNFGVVRIKRDILRRSALGVLFTHRSISSTGPGTNSLVGFDGVFAFYENLNINTYVAKTASDAGGDDMSYRAQMDYNADKYGLQVEHLFLDDDFNPDMGFVRRTAFRRSSAFARFSPRPRVRAIRKLTWDASIDYTTDTSGRLESREAIGAFRAELQNSDSMAVEYARTFEYLASPFAIAEAVTIPVGGYAFQDVRLAYYFGTQRPVAGIVKFERGRFYRGERTAVGLSRSRVEVTPQVSIEPNISIDWVDLPEGRFTTTLTGGRTTFTLTPRTAISALIQYSSSTRAFDTNVRFRWEYEPGSDLYVVYTDNRDMRRPRFPLLQSRGVTVKLTKLFRR